MNNQPVFKILVSGPQGSGKGTQAERLAETLGIPALSAGQLLRDEVAAGTDVGLQIKSILDQGVLVPEALSGEVIKRRLTRPDLANGYILDGYPRSLGQLEYFTFDQPTHMIVLNIPREESMRRITHRLTCNKCGAVASLLDGHTEGDICACGGVLKHRSDDTVEAMERRLAIYEKETRPVIEHFAKKGIVHELDGTGSIPEVFERILNVIKK